MRRLSYAFVICALTTCLTAGLLAAPGAAQTGDVSGFCAARLRADDEQSEKKTLAVLDEMVVAAPAVVRQPMTDLRDLYKKRGNRTFDSTKGTALLAQLEPFIYDNCPGQRVSV